MTNRATWPGFWVNLGLSGSGFAFGAFFAGTLSDRRGRRKPVMIAAALGYCLCWLPLRFGLPMPLWSSHALFFVMGLGAAGFTLSWACAKEVNKHALRSEEHTSEL